MNALLPIIVFIIIAVISAEQKKARAEAARRNRMGQPPRGGAPVPPPRPAAPGRAQPDYRQRAEARSGPDAGRAVARDVTARARDTVADQKTDRKRGFEKGLNRAERDFIESTSAADVKYTAQGCGCDARGNASGGRSHGSSNAMYDEERFFQEAQEMRSGRWT